MQDTIEGVVVVENPMPNPGAVNGQASLDTCAVCGWVAILGTACQVCGNIVTGPLEG